MPTTSLAGLTVAVTGGGHRIGRAIAQQFAGAGSRVTIGDLDADATGAAAEAIGGGARAATLDVSDRDGFAAFLDAAEQHHGPLDVMVNNAGVDWIGPFHEEP